MNWNISDVLEIQLVLKGEPYINKAKQYKNKYIKIRNRAKYWSNRDSPYCFITTAAFAPKTKGLIILSTTTSTQDSGLLDFLLPKFTEETRGTVIIVTHNMEQGIRLVDNIIEM